jgi:hypothetical protein
MKDNLLRVMAIAGGVLCLAPVLVFEVNNFSGGDSLSQHPQWALLALPAMALFSWAAREEDR